MLGHFCRLTFNRADLTILGTPFAPFSPEVKSQRLEMIMTKTPLLGVIVLLLAACGTKLQVLDAQAIKSSHSWLADRPTKKAVMERLGTSWKYVDGSERIYVYTVLPVEKGLDTESSENTDSERFDSNGFYELVLVFDAGGRLDRYSIIRVN